MVTPREQRRVVRNMLTQFFRHSRLFRPPYSHTVACLWKKDSKLRVCGSVLQMCSYEDPMVLNWTTFRRVILALLTLMNLGLLFVARQFDRKVRRADGFELRFDGGAVVPSGYLEDGSFYDARKRSTPCYLVRYVSVDCTYCWHDKSHWNALVARSRQSRCAIIGVVPQKGSALPGTAYGDGGNEQLVFTTMDWVRNSPPSRTPTTMIVGQQGTVLWNHVGQMDDQDLSKAWEALSSINK